MTSDYLPGDGTFDKVTQTISYAYTNLSAQLIWKDTSAEVFSSVSYNSGNKTIGFGVSNELITPCNAVIALLGQKQTTTVIRKLKESALVSEVSTPVTDPAVDTLWTWHIWVTDEVYPNKQVEVSGVYYDDVYLSYNGVSKLATLTNTGGASVGQVMPVNLGWVPDNSRFGLYQPREVWVKIQQTGENNCGTHNAVTLKIRQEYYPDVIPGTSTVYQWGRPTALPMLYKTTSTASVRAISDKTSSKDFQVRNISELSDALAWPHALVRHTGSTTHWWGTADNHALWSTTKTLYDPCPPGFQVPAADLFAVFNLSSGTSASNTTGTDANSHSYTTANYLNMWPDVLNSRSDLQRSGDQAQGGHFYLRQHTYDGSASYSQYGHHADSPWGIPAADRYTATIFMPATGYWSNTPADNTGMTSLSVGNEVFQTPAAGYYWTTGIATGGGTNVMLRPQYDYNGEVFNRSQTTPAGYAMPIRPKVSE